MTILQTFPFRLASSCAGVARLGILAASIGWPIVARAAISEPDTVIYGKIINRLGSSEELLTSGRLTWVISPPGGAPRSFSADLAPEGNGGFSYSLRLPHESVALDAPATSPELLPLMASLLVYDSLSITVDGHPATILDAGAASLLFSQEQRGRARRIDLRVGFERPDSDGDGMPDWWEQQYGLDFQSNDANGDLDGDGLSNLAEFLGGSAPDEDNRKPMIVTERIQAYAGGTSGILLQSLDTDTPPSALVYTITTLPAAGSLVLLTGPESPDSPGGAESTVRPLEVGATFTQSDITGGKLGIVFPDAPPEGDATFTVSLADGDPSHEPAVKAIALDTYYPETAYPVVSSEVAVGLTEAYDVAGARVGAAGGSETADRDRFYLLARDFSNVVWDGAAQGKGFSVILPEDAISPPVKHLLVGSPDDDLLDGGSGADIFVGNRGNDRLVGGPGSDRFVLRDLEDGNDSIADFSAGDGDILDIARLLQPSSVPRSLGNYLRWERRGDSTVISFDTNADGSGFDDLSLTLEKIALDQLVLQDWLASGRLLTGGIGWQPRISIRSLASKASESTLAPAIFVISRSGSLDTDLSVPISISGSATNGSDYAHLGSSIRFAPGQREVELRIVPFADAFEEPEETVEITLVSGEGYEIDGDGKGLVQIEDLAVLIGIEVAEARALLSPLTPGLLILRRSGIINRQVVVELEVAGTASVGSDFQSLPRFVDFAVGETAKLIWIQPMAGATLQGGIESVRLSVKPSTAFRIGAGNPSTVHLVARDVSLDKWRRDHLPDTLGVPLAELAGTDPDGIGTIVLMRYAGAPEDNSPSGSWPEVHLADGHLIIMHPRHPLALDLAYSIESMNSDGTWQDASPLLERLTPENIAGSALQRERYRTVHPVTAQAWRFFRVKVRYAP